MSFPLLDILGFGTKLIDKLIPDPQAKSAAQLELAKLAQNGELQAMQTQMSAILAEAQSADPWTSRARPSFLYVIYFLILWSVPMGILSAFRPETATAISAGMTSYLAAIPEGLYALFGVGYLGYAATRSYDKGKGAAK